MPEQTVSASLIFGSGIRVSFFQEQLATHVPPDAAELLADYELEWPASAKNPRAIDETEKQLLRETAARMLAAFQSYAMA